MVSRTACTCFLTAVLLSGLDAAGGEREAPAALRIEAEDYIEQQGATAPRYPMAVASGGYCVNHDWGGGQDHFLRYRFDLPADLPQVHFAIRYARASAGDAVVALVLDGREQDAVILRLPSTGGWGFEEHQWQWARALLPAARQGQRTLEIRSTRDRNNVNLDVFLLSPEPVATDPPRLVQAVEFEALRAAVWHLIDEYGPGYPAGRELLAELAAIEQASPERQAESLDALRRRALLDENPLMQFDRLLFTRRHPLGGQHYAYTENLSWATDRPRSWNPGASLCVLSPPRPEGTLRVLVDSPEGVIRDPDVYWDGSRVLFAHKKNLEHDDYSLYELDVASGRVRQLTSDAGFADYEGCYLPDGRIVFNSTRCVQTVDCFPVPVSNLYLMDGDGRNIHRLTVNHVHDNFPTVLNDGRVVFTRWEYNDRWVLHVQGLGVMRPDGTGTTALYGNNSFWPISMLHARAVPGSNRIICTLSGHHWVNQYGELGLFDPGLGREEAEGCIQLWPPRAIEPTRDEYYWRNLPAHYQYPYPLSEHFFLTSCRPRGKEHFGLYLIDTFGNQVLIWEDPNISCSSPMPLAPRPRPPILPSMVDYRRDDAAVYMADVYAGASLAGVPRGAVKSLRIIEMLNRPTGNPHWAGNDGTPPMGLCSSWDAKRVVGTVPVARDGSAAFTVPAGTAIYFQPLDEHGRALQWMRSWLTAQPGEQVGCVGCHEAPPETPSAGLGATFLRPPVPPAPWYASDRPFSFHDDVQGVLDAACIGCHDHDHPEGIDLRGDKTDAFSLGYEHLRRYVTIPGTRQDPPLIPARAQGAIASRLIDMLMEGHHDVVLSAEQMDRLITWVDLNAPYYGSYAITRYHANFGRCVVENAAPLWEALAERCYECHRRASQPPSLPEQGFGRFGQHEGRQFQWATRDRYDTSNAVLVNLTHPEQSRLLRAPLARAAGGLGLHDPSPFTSKDDPAYRAAFAVIRGWSEQLRRQPREDMPGAEPCPEYRLWKEKRLESLAIEAATRENLARQQGSGPKPEHRVTMGSDRE